PARPAGSPRVQLVLVPAAGGRQETGAGMSGATSETAAAILDVRAVTMRFGGLAAVKALTMSVPRGALYGLIGPNGAGKTTVFNVLTGVYCPTEGEISFDGTRVDGLKPYEITRLG